MGHERVERQFALGNHNNPTTINRPAYLMLKTSALARYGHSFYEHCTVKAKVTERVKVTQCIQQFFVVSSTVTHVCR
jgi:hypothetical protein